MKVAINVGGRWLIVPLSQVETVLQAFSTGLYRYDWDTKTYQRDPKASIEFRLVLEEAIVETPPAADEADEAGRP